jgi:tetratricopeptide (TPR) repeat protein
MLPVWKNLTTDITLIVCKNIIVCVGLFTVSPLIADESTETYLNNLSKAFQLSESANQAMLLRNYEISADDLQAALQLLDGYVENSSNNFHASLFCKLGKVRIEQGHWSAAEKSLTRCLQLADNLDESRLSAVALADLGQNAFKKGQLDKATSYLNKAIKIATKNRYLSTLAFARLWLGAISALRGNFDHAETELLEAVAIANKANDPSTEGRARNILGENSRLHGQYDDAIRHYQEALAIYQSINERFGMTMVIHNLGHVKTMMGDTETALQHYDESLRMAIDIQAIPAALEILAALAGIAIDKENYEQALDLLGVVFAHPASPKEALHMFAEPLLVRLQNKLPADTVEAGLARGGALNFDELVKRLLDKQN